MYTYPNCIHIWMECKSFFGKYGNSEIVFFWRRKKNWWSTCFCLVMEVTTQNSYFKFWILHGVGVGNGLNNNFLHFPPIFFAILDDFSKSEHTKKKIILQIFKAPFNSLLGYVGYLEILNFLSLYMLSWTYIDRPIKLCVTFWYIC